MIEIIKNHLINKHGEPNDTSSLEEYLLLISTDKNYPKDEYCENHHILTRSQFPEFINEKWNIVRLSYPDHVNAHILLYKSFNLRTYQSCLRYMSKDFKNSEMLSIASKKGWEIFKQDKEKYEKFCKERSEAYKKIPIEELCRRMRNYWDNTTAEERLKRGEANKKGWTKEVKEKQSKARKNYIKNNIEEVRKIAQKTWDNKTEEERDEFRKIMQIANSEPNRLKAIADKNKIHWQNPEFREKMSKRNVAINTYKLISPSGEIYIRQGLLKFAKEFNISPIYIRKFLDTDLEVTFTHKTKAKCSNNTKGWKFYTLIQLKNK
jgi:hypothetical protein